MTDDKISISELHVLPDDMIPWAWLGYCTWRAAPPRPACCRARGW